MVLIGYIENNVLYVAIFNGLINKSLFLIGKKEINKLIKKNLKNEAKKDAEALLLVKQNK